jgi:hypothetical protein
MKLSVVIFGMKLELPPRPAILPASSAPPSPSFNSPANSSCKETILCFQSLAASFAPKQNLTLSFSTVCSLFSKTPGVVLLSLAKYSSNSFLVPLFSSRSHNPPSPLFFSALPCPACPPVFWRDPRGGAFSFTLRALSPKSEAHPHSSQSLPHSFSKTPGVALVPSSQIFLQKLLEHLRVTGIASGASGASPSRSGRTWPAPAFQPRRTVSRQTSSSSDCPFR